MRHSRFGAFPAAAMIGVLMLLFAPATPALNSVAYYPLVAGNQWTYQVETGGVQTTRVDSVLSTQTTVNGTAAYVVSHSDDGSFSYITNDAMGIHEHGGYQPARAVSVIFTPPALDLPAQFAAGQTYSTSGSASWEVIGVGAFPLVYSGTGHVFPVEAVTVPAGTFQAVRISASLNLSGAVGTTYFDDTTTKTHWLVEGIGPVKSIIVSNDGTTETSSLVSTNVSPSAATISLSTGWNLVGNTRSTQINVAAAFGSSASPVANVTARVQAIWKWDAAHSAWQFYAPQFSSAGLASYAASHGYGVLATINPGEGYWVNASGPFNLPAQSGTARSLAAADLGGAWNLVATAADIDPRQLNAALNFFTLWAWSNPDGKWYFYAPFLDTGGTTLADYANRKHYLDFFATGKRLGPDVGFWVNRP